jgi:hypothetical protein
LLVCQKWAARRFPLFYLSKWSPARFRSESEGRLCGLPLAVTLSGLGLQAVEEGDGALGVSSGSEDRAFVVLQNFKPVRDVTGMIFSRLRSDAKIGGQERAAKFGNKLLGGIAFVAPTLASELAIEPLFVASPVGLMPISA